jgi:hypothetical protein
MGLADNYQTIPPQELSLNRQENTPSGDYQVTRIAAL